MPWPTPRTTVGRRCVRFRHTGRHRRAATRAVDLTDRRVRTLTATNLACCLGTGLWTPLGPLWATRVLHLPVGRVGLIYTVTGALSLLIAVPVGRTADRVGAAPVYAAGLAVQAAAMGVAISARDQTGFAAATFLLTAAGQAAAGGRAALIAQLAPTRSTDLAAWLRRGTNLGAALAFLAAAPVIAAGRASAYRAAAAAIAVLCVLCAASAARLSAGSAPRHRQDSRVRPLRDRPYLAVTALCAALSLHFDLFAFALPLWTLAATRAPLWAVSAAGITNTLIVVVAQGRIGAAVRRPQQGSRALAAAGLLAAGGCAAAPAITALPPPGALIAVLAFTAVLSAAELQFTAGCFAVSYLLAPAGAHGAYQGVFALGRGAVKAAAPALLTGTLLQRGCAGWLTLAAIFLLAALPVRPAVLRAAHTRIVGDPPRPPRPLLPAAAV